MKPCCVFLKGPTMQKKLKKTSFNLSESHTSFLSASLSLTLSLSHTQAYTLSLFQLTTSSSLLRNTHKSKKGIPKDDKKLSTKAMIKGFASGLFCPKLVLQKNVSNI